MINLTFGLRSAPLIFTVWKSLLTASHAPAEGLSCYISHYLDDFDVVVPPKPTITTSTLV